MAGPIRLSCLTLLVWLACAGAALAGGLLDGRVFEGMIGPRGNPDLADSLHFEDGHFWSDICTACGFRPGPYTARETEAGIVFRGVLHSDSRGRFDYDGLVLRDGAVEVSIGWERARWYWTTRRQITFRGTEVAAPARMGLQQVRSRIEGSDPAANPRCARF